MSWPRTRILILVVAALALAFAATLFWFGGPQPPGDTPGAVAPSSVAAAADPDVEPPSGGVDMPLIPIPGCKCHSDDPQVVEEHSRYRLSDCRDCH